MRPTLLLVKESSESTLLNSSNEEEEEEEDAIFSIKSEGVSLDKFGDFSEEEDIDPSPHDEDIQAHRVCSVVTASISNQMGSFVVHDTPSRSLGSEFLDGLVAPSMEVCPTKEFTPSAGQGGSHILDGIVNETYDCSIYEFVVVLGNQPNSWSMLEFSDLGSFLHYRVKYLPSQYSGDAIYELPPILAPKEGTARRLVGMNRSCNRHAWTET